MVKPRSPRPESPAAPKTPEVKRAGVVALVGRPNVGKSTLLNALIGESISIVTPKPETTRDRVLAVVTNPFKTQSQFVIIDTPGIHRPHRQLGEYMNAEARNAAEGADAVVMLADASEGLQGPDRDENVWASLATVTKPVVLVLNKVDKIKAKGELLPLLESYAKKREFHAMIPVSAQTGNGVAELAKVVAELLPEGVPLYPVDALTDRPERWLVSERIREAVMLETGEEVPYVTAVEIESYDERPTVPRITAAIHVERPGQLKIMVGAGGERIKAIGSLARANVERMLGKRVHLELRVKVSPDWTRTAEGIARFGYRQDKPPA